jgi:hypothetical protein
LDRLLINNDLRNHPALTKRHSSLIPSDPSTNLIQSNWNYTTPNEDGDSATSSLSYKNRLASVSGNLINFYLEADLALAAWELNNDSLGSLGRYALFGNRPNQFPDGQLNTAGYFYHTPALSGEKLRLVRENGLRFLTNPDEAMAYAVQSPTKTVGAQGATRGSIDDWVNLSDYNFGTNHSAQWNFEFQTTYSFYEQLLVKLNIATQ